MYLLAILFPPLAALFCGKPLKAFVAAILSLFLWIPGVLYALLVVADYDAERRQARHFSLAPKDCVVRQWMNS